MSNYEEREELQQYMRGLLNRYPVIKDPEKVVQLLERWRHHGDRRAYDQLVYGNSRLIISIAFKFQNQGVPLLDLIQEGFIGLMKALETFDPKRGSLSTFATWWIRSLITRHIPYVTTKRPYSMTPKIYGMVGLMARSLKNFFNQKGYWPNDQEVHAWIHTADGTADETRNVKDMTMKKVKLCLRLIYEGYSSLDAPLAINGEEENDRSLSDVVADTTVDVEKIVESRLELNKLEPRTRTILRARLLDETTLGEIGKHFELSRERIRQIEKMGLEKIRRRKKVYLGETTK